ncbi:cytochrome P450 [Falsirhodobacter sp. 20TX0035]|uniref:cytochrome P450 n=1 Tax=Falsirhodobacter sp. 20TX0035 TaxID=3022019 RepID=UPI00232C4B87|nr:cytochrome P450 [Falsirhodobacter sp. 20TX0035]MDB6453648.1 cytochrome P450 [Falsirhodobacter sp. 20TX0035]
MTRQDHEAFGPQDGVDVAIPATLPRLPGLDHTLTMLRQGYDFIGSHCDRLGVDGFRIRLLGQDAVCLRGPEAAQLLYGTEGLTRKGAMPATVLRLLQDKGSVQQLEGEEHRRRKGLFIRMLMDKDRLDRLVHGFEAAWRAQLRPDMDITVMDLANTALARAACHWVGLSPNKRRMARLTRILFAMSDRAGHFGPATLATLWQRRGVERWIASEIRAGRMPEGSPMAILSQDMPPKVAAVEVLNLLRPIVAVGRYIAFAAKALHEHPIWCGLFNSGNADYIPDFCEEVRRTSPFFPFTAAMTERDVIWQGATIPAGTRVIFDIHGTHHDSRFFPQPDRFRPERMLDWTLDDPAFAPQGTGDLATTHRCPGEAATLALMSSAVRMLCCEMRYEVPDQDLSVRMNRIPAQPASGVRIRVQAID